jgi:hypothetical protein
MAAVGATIGAIGAVTGDKSLQTAGMIVGGIGGIGSLAAGAGLFGDATTSAANAFGGATTAADIPATASASVMNGAGGAVSDATAAMAASGPTSADIIGSVTGNISLPGAATDTLASAASAASPTTITGNTLSGGLGNNIKLAVPLADANPTGTGATAESDYLSSLAVPSTNTVNGTPGVPYTPTAAQMANTPIAPITVTPLAQATSAPADPTVFDKVLGAFTTSTNNNLGLIGMGVVQSAGSLLSGATSTLTPAQVASYNAQAAANNANAAMTTMQAANMSGAIPTASRGSLMNSVTGAV